MKREEYSDETTQAQLQEFADQLRAATATEMSICIISGATDEEPAHAAACAMAFDGKTFKDVGKSQIEAAFAMLKVAALIIDKNTGGTVKVRLHSRAGEFPISPGSIDKWRERLGR